MATRAERRRQAVAKLLHDALEVADKSSAEVAREAGLSKATLSRILSAQTLAEPDTLRALARVLPVSYYSLMQAAQYIEAQPERDETLDLFLSLPEALQREVVDYGHFRLRSFDSGMIEPAATRDRVFILM